tara:strand:- start:805 stop:1323 length:519 start_codon:yes stop_codon:yes gene_type:complete
MASSKQTPKEPEENQIDLKNYNKYKTNPSSSVKGIEMDLNDLDRLLENEQQNKSENWNKLDKTQKLQKLNKYAEMYGEEKSLSPSEIKVLKTFFKDSLNKNKLQKTKDLQYDKDKGVVLNIPSLTFNSTNKMYTLKNMDPKRVSTVKCLPKKKPIVITDEVPEDVCEKIDSL